MGLLPAAALYKALSDCLEKMILSSRYENIFYVLTGLGGGVMLDLDKRIYALLISVSVVKQR